MRASHPVLRSWDPRLRSAGQWQESQCVLPTLPGQAAPHPAPVLNLKGKKCQLYRARSWGQPVMGQGSGQGQVGWGRGQCTCLAWWAAHYKMEDQSGAGGPELGWCDEMWWYGEMCWSIRCDVSVSVYDLPVFCDSSNFTPYIAWGSPGSLAQCSIIGSDCEQVNMDDSVHSFS